MADKNARIRNAVRESYGKVALESFAGCDCGCGGSSCGPGGAATAEEIAVGLGYTSEDAASVPEGANMGLGCGNPQLVASLKAGDTVVDLGSGGGFDCFLAARAVGPEGSVIGVDMTPEMVEKARENATTAGLANVEFRLGEIEHLPVADATADVVISNCVINLSPEKAGVFKEAYRILKSGGRLAVSDIVATVELPERVREDLALHAGCVAGAVTEDAITGLLEEAGFVGIRIRPWDQSKKLIREWAGDGDLADYIFSASIEATKP